MKNNLLIFFPYFSTEKFFESRNRADWELISIVDLLKRGIFGILTLLRGQRWDTVAIGRPKLETQEAKYHLQMMLIVSNALEKFFVGNDGVAQKTRFSRFLFLETPRFVLESIFVLFFLAFCHLWLAGLWAIYALSQRKIMTKHSLMKKRLAYFRTDDFGGVTVGGSFTHVSGFARALRSLGWDVSFYAPEKPYAEAEGHNHLAKNFTFKKILYPAWFQAPEIPEIYYDFRVFFHALRLLWKSKPDVLYHRHTAFQAHLGLLARILGRPLIMEYNGSEPWIKEKWGRLFLRRLCYAYERVALKGADRIAVVSDVLKDELIGRGIPEQKIILNPNGVAADLFDPVQANARVHRSLSSDEKARITVGFIGSFGPWHGVHVLAEIVKPCLEQNPRLHFLIIGDGALAPYVQSKIHADGVSQHVTLTGSIPHCDAPSYLAGCDILVSPHVPNSDGTRFFGSPTKIFEYMAMGKAIVASDLEQIGKILVHMKTALLVPPGDRTALIAAIIKLAGDSNLRNSLGSAARETVVKNYTWEENAKRILTALQQ